MARRARNDENGRVHLPPPPSFLSLPDIAHASISSFLHYGNKGKACASPEACRDLRDAYGGSLNQITLCYVEAATQH